MNSSREHLDAETVAAWIDGGLDTASLAAAEAHAANCERCQALLATVTRTLPANAVPEARHEASGTGWLWKWLAPVTAAAAAVTIWMVVPQEPMRRPATTAVEQEAPPAPTAPPPTKPMAPPAAIAAAPPKPAAPSAREERFADARRDAGKSLEAKAERPEAQAGGADLGALRERQEKAAVSVTAAPPAPAERARDVAAPAAAVGAVSALRKQAAPLEFVSPDPAYRWRVIPGAAEYSQDGGRTWIPVAVAAGGSLTAGSSPAPRVCWMVGRRGLVLLSVDGTTFTRLPFPETADLVAVTAFDALRAIVTAADGRTFETSDNGRTWRNP